MYLPALYLCFMNIFKLAFELFIIYMVYKLVFDFIIPVYRTTRQMKQKMSDMHQKMKEQERNQQQFNAPTDKKTTVSSPKYADDYIDYEEVK